MLLCNVVEDSSPLATDSSESNISTLLYPSAFFSSHRASSIVVEKGREREREKKMGEVARVTRGGDRSTGADELQGR